MNFFFCYDGPLEGGVGDDIISAAFHEVLCSLHKLIKEWVKTILKSPY